MFNPNERRSHLEMRVIFCCCCECGYFFHWNCIPQLVFDRLTCLCCIIRCFQEVTEANLIIWLKINYIIIMYQFYINAALQLSTDCCYTYVHKINDPINWEWFDKRQLTKALILWGLCTFEGGNYCSQLWVLKAVPCYNQRIHIRLFDRSDCASFWYFLHGLLWL